jgi:hypothetical protein
MAARTNRSGLAVRCCQQAEHQAAVRRRLISAKQRIRFPQFRLGVTTVRSQPAESFLVGTRIVRLRAVNSGELWIAKVKPTYRIRIAIHLGCSLESLREGDEEVLVGAPSPAAVTAISRMRGPENPVLSRPWATSRRQARLSAGPCRDWP